AAKTRAAAAGGSIRLTRRTRSSLADRQGVEEDARGLLVERRAHRDRLPGATIARHEDGAHARTGAGPPSAGDDAERRLARDARAGAVADGDIAVAALHLVRFDVAQHALGHRGQDLVARLWRRVGQVDPGERVRLLADPRPEHGHVDVVP